MQATQYSDVNELLDILLSGMKQVLAKKLVGLYLYGSLVWGDFDHDVSDIDLLAATSADVDEREVAALEQMHTDFAHMHKEWEDRIEVHYLSTAGLRTFKSSSTMTAVISPGEPFHIIEAGNEYLMNWFSVQQRGVVIFGPSPGSLIEPITREEFIEAVREHVRGWSEWISGAKHSRPYQSYAILTLCRAFYTHTFGQPVSKKQAALWAEEELPQWASLIGSALKWREDAVKLRGTKQAEEIVHEETYQQASLFVQYVSDRILSG